LIKFNDLLEIVQNNNNLVEISSLISHFEKELNLEFFKQIFQSFMKNKSFNKDEDYFKFISSCDSLSKFYEEFDEPSTAKECLKEIFGKHKFNMESYGNSIMSLDITLIDLEKKNITLLYEHFCGLYANFSKKDDSPYLKIKNDTKILSKLSDFHMTKFQIIMFTSALKNQPIKDLLFNPCFSPYDNESLEIFFKFEERLRKENKFQKEYKEFSETIKKRVRIVKF
jgi:hypothetical protein